MGFNSGSEIGQGRPNLSDMRFRVRGCYTLVASLSVLPNVLVCQSTRAQNGRDIGVNSRGSSLV